jgi:hypothetical protein
MALLPEAANDAVLVFRQHIGLHIVDVELAGYRFRRCPVVAGQHDDAHTVGAQAFECGGCCGFDGIGNGNDAPGSAIEGKKERCCALTPQRVGFSDGMVCVPPDRPGPAPSVARITGPAVKPDGTAITS